MDTVPLKKGKTYVLRLKGLASAGYTWQYTADNEDMVDINVDYQMPEPLTQKNMGTSADEVFTITGLKKGETTIRFVQVRSWEDKDAVPANQKVLKLVISE